MRVLLQETVLPFLQRNWWMWLALFAVSLAILIIGPGTVGQTVYDVFEVILSLILFGVILFWLFYFTVGRGILGVWQLARLVGLCGVVFFLILDIRSVKEVPLEQLLWEEKFQKNRSNFILFVALTAISLLFYIAGELLLYLHKINFKIRNSMVLNLARNASLYSLKTEMTCPRCLGKGYVDKNDIERMEMDGELSSGACEYCEATGHVERGKPLKQDPSEVVQQSDIDILANIFKTKTFDSKSYEEVLERINKMTDSEIEQELKRKGIN